MSLPAAFFDLDRTLIASNSALLWARHERGRGAITRRQLARASIWTLLYHFSLVDIESAYAEATMMYRGQERELLDARTRRWFHAEIAPLLRPQAVEAMAWHRAQGHPLVLLTSATCFEAKVAAEHWKFDAWLANDFEHDASGRLTGQVQLPLVYGPGKVHHATRYANRHGVSLGESYFYSDSYSDLPMLEAVGHARVVTPDPRLRRAAKRRRWPILDWTRP